MPYLIPLTVCEVWWSKGPRLNWLQTDRQNLHLYSAKGDVYQSKIDKWTTSQLLPELTKPWINKLRLFACRAHKRICCSLAWLPILVVFTIIVAIFVKTFTVSERCVCPILIVQVVWEASTKDGKHCTQAGCLKGGILTHFFSSGSSLPHCQRRSPFSSTPTTKPNYCGQESWEMQSNFLQSPGILFYLSIGRWPCQDGDRPKLWRAQKTAGLPHFKFSLGL